MKTSEEHRVPLTDEMLAILEPLKALQSGYVLRGGKAFALACRSIDVKYNPHSVKDTLAAERDCRTLTQQQRKA